MRIHCSSATKLSFRVSILSKLRKFTTYVFKRFESINEQIEERLKRKEIAFGVCSTLLLSSDVPEGPARLPLEGRRCFIGRAPRSFEAWEWLRTRTSRSALAYAHVKTEAAADFETVEPRNTEYIPARGMRSHRYVFIRSHLRYQRSTSFRLRRGGGACTRRQGCGAG